MWIDLVLKQERLDSLIVQKHNLQAKNLYTCKKIALLVELGELANEIEFFKFWKVRRKSFPEKVKEEYVDCIHLMLSILHTHPKYPAKYDLSYMLDNAKPFNYNNLEDQFASLFSEISTNLYSSPDYAFQLLLGLGSLLGISLKDIQIEYNMKYKINIKRQREGY